MAQEAPEHGVNFVNLPVDNTQLTPQDEGVLNSIFEQKGEEVKKLGKNLKIPLLAGAVFFAFNLPIVDDLFNKVFKAYMDMPYIMLMIKVLIFTVIVFLIYYWGSSS